MYKLDNFNEFRDECHAASVKVGWWSNSQRYGDRATGVLDPDYLTIPTKLCLIHSEISEADEGYFSGARDQHLPEWPGALIEFGDTLIRIGDLAGYCDLDMTTAIFMIRQADYVEATIEGNGHAQAGFRYLHRFTSEAMEGYRKSAMDRRIPAMAAFPAGLARVVVLIDAICERNGWNLADACVAKMAYNAIREDHKLEVRSLSGGKTF